MLNVDILRKVQQHFRTHPETADMNIWIRDSGCRTVGCINGWLHRLAGVDDPDYEKPAETILSEKPAETILSGAEILGISYDQASALFLPYSWPDTWYNKLEAVRYGTSSETEADVVCGIIDSFIEDMSNFPTRSANV